MNICLLDTTVFVEILDIPRLAERHDEISSLLEQKINAGEKLFLPIATILETGNHISQNGDGSIRRKIAQIFVNQVMLAIKGESPFTPIFGQSFDGMIDWLADFPEFAMRGKSLGDLSIVQDWERMCAINPRRRVYIWALDSHLAGYDRGPR